jgi:curved DNA-binding protein CbpA
MAVTRDLYLILKVAPIAGDEELRKSYRQLSKKFHPDLNPDSKQYAEMKMKEIVEAYNVLSNKDRRKDYNNQPWFQVKKARSKKKSMVADGKDFARKPAYEKEASLLDRILSPFLKKKGKNEGVKVDYVQSDVHFTLGLTLAQNEAFYEKAKGEFRESLKFDPAATDALYNYGIMCYKLGEYDDARVSFQKYVSKEKEDPHGRKMLTLLADEY